MDSGELVSLLVEQGLTKGVKFLFLGVEDLEVLRRVSELVGGEGVVYAVDKDRERLGAVSGYGNVKPFFSPLLERIPYLPNSMFDMALLHHSLERVDPYYLTMLNETHRLLKGGGRAVAVARVRSLFSRTGVKEKELEKALSTTPLRLERKEKRSGEMVLVFSRTPSEEG